MMVTSRSRVVVDVIPFDHDHLGLGLLHDHHRGRVIAALAPFRAHRHHAAGDLMDHFHVSGNVPAGMVAVAGHGHAAGDEDRRHREAQGFRFERVGFAVQEFHGSPPG